MNAGAVSILVVDDEPPIRRLLRTSLTAQGYRIIEADIKLSPKEYDILQQLVLHAGKVLTHKHLLHNVWGPATSDVQYLRIYIRQLRQKLEADPEQPKLILTEAGVGYRLQPANE